MNFSSSDIVKILSQLKQNKAHGHDMVSMRMIKLCGKSICKPIFNVWVFEGKFPHEWKKLTLQPYIRKETNSLKNYRRISLLPICSKIFECLIYNEMFTFLLRPIWSLQINQDLDLGTLVLTNYLLLPRKFINRFIRGLKLEGFSEIYLKLLISYDIKA